MIVPCSRCQAVVNGEELANLEHSDTDDYFETVRFAFLKCPQCGGPLVAAQAGDPVLEKRWDDEKKSEVDFAFLEWGEAVRVYPSPDRRADYRLPKQLRECFDEALGCLRANLYASTALMCRKTLEGLCQLKGAPGGLGVGLKRLHDNGVIDDRLFGWAEALRQDGNLAAHDLEVRVSRDDANHIVDFTEAILEYVFVLSERFQEFQELRAKRSKVRKPSDKPPA